MNVLAIIAIIVGMQMPVWQVGMQEPWRPLHQVATDVQFEQLDGYYWVVQRGEVVLVGSGIAGHDTLLYARRASAIAAWCNDHAVPGRNWREALRPVGICERR